MLLWQSARAGCCSEVLQLNKKSILTLREPSLCGEDLCLRTCRGVLLSASLHLPLQRRFSSPHGVRTDPA